MISSEIEEQVCAVKGIYLSLIKSSKEDNMKITTKLGSITQLIERIIIFLIM